MKYEVIRLIVPEELREFISDERVKSSGSFEVECDKEIEGGSILLVSTKHNDKTSPHYYKKTEDKDGFP